MCSVWSMSEWLDFWHEMTMDNQEDWCNLKINQDLIHGPISLLTTAYIPKISLFQCTRNYTQPQLEFFPPIQSSMAEVSHRGDEDSLADPYLKEISPQVPEAPQTRWSDEREGAVESKQISSWLFMLPLGLWDFVGSWKYMQPQIKPSWMQSNVVCVWSDNCWASPKQILSRPTAKT